MPNLDLNDCRPPASSFALTMQLEIMFNHGCTRIDTDADTAAGLLSTHQTASHFPALFASSALWNPCASVLIRGSLLHGSGLACVRKEKIP